MKPNWSNRTLFHGDNLDVMEQIDQGLQFGIDHTLTEPMLEQLLERVMVLSNMFLMRTRAYF